MQYTIFVRKEIMTFGKSINVLYVHYENLKLHTFYTNSIERERKFCCKKNFQIQMNNKKGIFCRHSAIYVRSIKGRG